MRDKRSALGGVFHRLLLGGGVANLGDGMARVLLPLLALSIGAPVSGVAAVTAASTLAWPVFGLHAGWLVDRADRRRLLVAANFVRALALTTLAVLAITDELRLAMILAAALTLGVCEAIVDTAVTSCVPMVVRPSQYGRANARIEVTVNVTNELLGPSMAGLLAGLTLTAAAGSAAGLYLLAGVVLVGVRLVGGGARDRREVAGGSSRGAWGRGLTTGLRFVWRQPLIRSLVLFTAAMNVVWGGTMALFVVYAVAPGQLGLNATSYGLLLTTMAAGGLVASALTEPLRRLVGDARLLVADCVGTVLLVLPLALGAGVAYVAAGAVVAGAGSSVWRIVNATIRQVATPDDLLGRVYAATRVISWGVMPASAAGSGVAADIWGVRAVFVALTVLAIAIVLGFLPFAAAAGRVAKDVDADSDPHRPASYLVGEAP